MVSDSITTAPIPSAANAKNLGKKKRANRSAKLKQCKIDARREQWLSQVMVKNKNYKDGGDDGGAPLMPVGEDNKHSWEKLEMSPRVEEIDGSILQDAYMESLSNSPSSVDSSMLGSNGSGRNFSVSSSSGSSAGTCSGNVTEEEEEEEEEEGDDDCLDDWEAVADALAADDKHQSPCSELPPAQEPGVQVVSPCEMTRVLNLGAGDSKTESDRLVPLASGNSRAWRPDDAFRPQSLPNLAKQYSLPNPDSRSGGGIPWAPAAPSPCPICCEDLDLTDSCFLPCLCGFRLCLFCHKKILEQDGRCPGCRKPYDCKSVEPEANIHGGSLSLHLERSRSMIYRG